MCVVTGLGEDPGASLAGGPSLGEGAEGTVWVCVCAVTGLGEDPGASLAGGPSLGEGAEGTVCVCELLQGWGRTLERLSPVGRLSVKVLRARSVCVNCCRAGGGPWSVSRR